MNFVTVNGLQLAYRIDGADVAAPLVLLNALGTDLRMWDEQVAALSAGFRVIRYDMRGHGRSGIPHEPASLEQLGHDLLALLDHLGIERAHVCGISLGGIVALWLAIHHPERVERAVFANTAARIGSEALWEGRIAAVREGGMRAVRGAVIARLFSDHFRARHPERVCLFGDMLSATDPAGYTAACAALRDGDLRASVGHISAPSLILAGALDQATPPAQSEELHAAIAGSELVVLAEAAHLSNVEQPEIFNTYLLQWFGSRQSA
ncbi:MAG: 3-oxoadipate enol-lactonase [Herpetosiphonaceae bacterium]|nr:MAG: 3-oxoadipate enol-lactonase [Herpetosiphonaceae bacterium]